MHRNPYTFPYLYRSVLSLIIIGGFSIYGLHLHAQVSEDIPPPELVEWETDAEYVPWKNYSKAGLWVVPLATPFSTSPYDELRYQPKSGTGRIGASLAEWSYINQAGVNADVLTPDGFQVTANTEGLYGLKSENKKEFIIPAKYRQLEYLTRDILVGWIEDHLEIWTSKGEKINRIKYGFEEGQAPRFTVNLPAIQRGGDESDSKELKIDEGTSLMSPYARDQNFLAPRQLVYYDNFMPNTRFVGLYKVANCAQMEVLSAKGSLEPGKLTPAELRDSSLEDSLFIMLIEHQGEYQLLANQGIQLFRMLPFTFPSKGKTRGRFTGKHMGRVGPLYPSIYYDYRTPKLNLKGNNISLSISFTEHQANNLQKRIFTYELRGKRSDYNERLTLVSGNYRNKTQTAIYQYQKGNSVSLIYPYGSTLIPAGKYKNFMVAKAYSLLGETFDGQIELLDHGGRKMSKAQFMRANKIKVKPGIHRLIAGAGGGGMLYRDSLEFIGPFLPLYDIKFLRNDQPVFINRDLEHSILFDIAQNSLTDTIPGILSPPNARYPAYIPFKLKNKAGYYKDDFTTMIPPIYNKLSLNLSHKKGEVFFTYVKDSQTAIMNLEGKVVRGPTTGSLPLRLTKNLYMQFRSGGKYLLDTLWNPIIERGFEKFPLRWSMLNKDIRYVPFEEKGKYGILDMAGKIVDEAIHDTLIVNFAFLNQFYGIGKPGEFELIDARKAYRYPDRYKQIYDFFTYPGVQELPRTYQQNVKSKFKSRISAVLEKSDGNILFLLANGRIVEGKELE